MLYRSVAWPPAPPPVFGSSSRITAVRIGDDALFSHPEIAMRRKSLLASASRPLSVIIALLAGFAAGTARLSLPARLHADDRNLAHAAGVKAPVAEVLH